MADAAASYSPNQYFCLDAQIAQSPNVSLVKKDGKLFFKVNCFLDDGDEVALDPLLTEKLLQTEADDWLNIGQKDQSERINRMLSLLLSKKSLSLIDKGDKAVPRFLLHQI